MELKREASYVNDTVEGLIKMAEVKAAAEIINIGNP